MAATAKCMSAKTASVESIEPHTITRYAPGDNDVAFDIKYCGICHTDVHFVKNDMGFSQYPMTPGHELAGVVTAVGSKVTKLKVGDKVGVGCMVDACTTCKSCTKLEEQYCGGGSVFTYGGVTKYGRAGPDGQPTHGGYSDKMVVNDRFAIKIPDSAELDKCAPLLCAGITMYDPLVRHGAGPGVKVGVIGIGGLGQMGVRIAAAMGCEVTAISTTASKEAEAKAIGAKNFVVSTDADQMTAAAALGLDMILDTVSANHEIMPYAGMLDAAGKYICIGLTTAPFSIAAPALLFSQKTIQGSLIGGTKATQEMIDFCCEKGIYPAIQVIPATDIIATLKKLDEKNDSVVRYVIDCATIPAA